LAQSWNGSCAGYTRTLVGSADWLGGVGSQIYTYQLGGFGQHDILVVKIRPSATKTQAKRAGSINAAEFASSATNRWGSLSTLPCDLSGTGLIIRKDNTAPTFTAQSGTAPPTESIWVGANPKGRTVVLQPGVEYYYNITNQNPAGGTSCNTAFCDMLITVIKPKGT
jgi:hypothetical protein